MKRFFHDNGKKILAVLGVILMITFFLPSSARNPRSDASATPVANVFGSESITAGEAQQYALEFDALKQIPLKNTGANAEQQQQQPALAVLGSAGQRMTEKAFMLLVLEAHKTGVGVDPDEYNTFLANNVQLPDPASDQYDVATSAMHDLLLVNNLLQEVGQAQKVSAPYARFAMAVTQQELSVDVAMLPLSRYITATQPTLGPTTQQVQEQYDKYSGNLPDQPTALNPIGFGYSLPDRVKLDYVGISQADVRVAAIGRQSSIEWRTQARRWYREHTSDFIVDTQPSTAPATQRAATTKPAWEELTDDVVGKVYDRIYDNAADDLAKTIMKQIADQLDQDWSATRIAQSKAQTAPATMLGAAYGTSDYLQQLSDSIGKQYGIRPIVGFTGDRLLGAKDIDAIDPFGKSESLQGAKASQYIMTRGDQFTAAQGVPQPSRISAWEPSPEMDVYGMTASPTHRFIFRIVAMDPRHSAPLDAVRDQVIKDVLAQQTWDQANTEAANLLTRAKTTGLTAAAATLSPPVNVLASGSFGQSSYLTTIPGLTLSPASVQAFATAAGKLLGSVTATEPHPVGSIDLPAENAVAVMQLKQTKPTWDTSVTLGNQQSEVAYAIENENAQGIYADWASFDNVAARTKYKTIDHK